MKPIPPKFEEEAINRGVAISSLAIDINALIDCVAEQREEIEKLKAICKCDCHKGTHGVDLRTYCEHCMPPGFGKPKSDSPCEHKAFGIREGKRYCWTCGEYLGDMPKEDKSQECTLSSDGLHFVRYNPSTDTLDCIYCSKKKTLESKPESGEHCGCPDGSRGYHNDSCAAHAHVHEWIRSDVSWCEIVYKDSDPAEYLRDLAPNKENTAFYVCKCGAFMGEPHEPNN